MTVQDKKFAARFFVDKHQPFVDFDTGEERDPFPVLVCELVQVAGDDGRVGAGEVVVAEEQVEPPGAVEALEQVEDGVVSFADVGEAAVFEQFVAIADFDVGVALGVVVLQGVEEEDFVGDKVVRPGAVAAMGVAKEDEAGVVVEGDARGGLEEVGEVVVWVHRV